MKSLQKIGLICALCSFALGSVFVFAPESANASSLGNSTILAKKSSGGKSKSHSKPSKKPNSKSSKSSSSAKKNGGKKSNNKYAKASLSGHCKKIGGKCVVFSKSGCGNFYVGGYHYGKKSACKVLGIRCSTPNRPGGNGGGTVFRRVTSGAASATASTTRSGTSTALTRDCTPGVSCPADDLGGILEQALVTPAYAGRNTKTCPLFWVTGREDADSKIKCTLDVGTDRALIDVPNNPVTDGYQNGYPLPIGKYTLVCTRTTQYDDKEIGTDASGNEVVLSTTRKTDIQKQEKILECKQNPAFREF